MGRKMITKICINCGKEYECRPDHINKSKFCSYFCKGTYEKKHNPNFKRKTISYGKDHPNWKGGKIINSQGYCLIKNRDHKYADHQGYVREHRLVMEKHLGRYLLPTEDVHHINGIKTDNRIENLELITDRSKHIKKYHSQKLEYFFKKGQKAYPHKDGCKCFRCTKTSPNQRLKVISI